MGGSAERCRPYIYRPDSCNSCEFVASLLPAKWLGCIQYRHTVRKEIYDAVHQYPQMGYTPDLIGIHPYFLASPTVVM